MDVNFTLTREDLRRFGRYCLFHRPRVLYAALITGFGTGVLVTGILSLLVGQWPPVVQWWFFPLNIAFAVLNLWKTRFGITQALKDIPGLLGGVSLRITPSGIEAHTSLTNDRSLWARQGDRRHQRRHLPLHRALPRLHRSPSRLRHPGRGRDLPCSRALLVARPARPKPQRQPTRCRRWTATTRPA